MRKRNLDPDYPRGKLREVCIPGLPPPHKLVMPRDEVKVTLTLSLRSVLFFKEIALKNHAKYQPMIRKLLDDYVDHYHPPRQA